MRFCQRLLARPHWINPMISEQPVQWHKESETKVGGLYSSDSPLSHTFFLFLIAQLENFFFSCVTRPLAEKKRRLIFPRPSWRRRDPLSEHPSYYEYSRKRANNSFVTVEVITVAAHYKDTLHPGHLETRSYRFFWWPVVAAAIFFRSVGQPLHVNNVLRSDHIWTPLVSFVHSVV